MAAELNEVLPTPPNPTRDEVLRHLRVPIDRSVAQGVPQIASEVAWMALHESSAVNRSPWDIYTPTQKLALAEFLKNGKYPNPEATYLALARSWVNLHRRLTDGYPYDHPKYAVMLREDDQNGLAIAERVFSEWSNQPQVKKPWLDLYERQPYDNWDRAVLEQVLPTATPHNPKVVEFKRK